MRSAGRFPPGISPSPINDITRIIRHCFVYDTYKQRNVLYDQLTVDFIHQTSSLLLVVKYYLVSCVYSKLGWVGKHEEVRAIHTYLSF